MNTNHQFAHGDDSVGGFCDLTPFQSEDRYRAIVEAQTELICRFLPDRTLSFVNLAFCHYFGKQRHELIGENFLLLIPEAEQEAVQHHWRSLNLDNPIGTYEHPVIAPHGEIRSHQWTNRAIFDRQGRLVEFQCVGRENTECQQAEEALRESEERWRTTFEQAAVGISNCDLTGQLLRINQKFCDIVGYTREEMLLRTWRDITHPDDLEANLENNRRILAGEIDTYTMEKRYIRKDGSIIWGNLTVSVVRKSSGEPKYTVAAVQDISEHKQAQEALYRREQEFRALVENSPDIIARLDQQLRHLYVNPAVEQATGIPPQAYIGKTTWDVGMPQEKATFWDEALQSVFATGQERIIEFDFPTPNGIKYYQNRIVPEFNQDGTIASLLAVGRDISDVYRQAAQRKLVEEALRQSEERFRNLVETTSDWVWELDEEGIYTYVSPKVRDILGYTAQEIYGRTPCDFMPRRERYRIANLFSQIVAVQDSFTALENTSIHKDGHLVVMETSGVPIFDANGKLSGYRGISREMTERKRMEEALRESQQKYQTLFEIFPIGISITDEMGNLIEANPASEKILGISTAEHGAHKYNSPEWQAVQADGTPMPGWKFPTIKALTENRVIKNFEMGTVKPDGGITWLSLTAAPIPLPGYGVAVAYIDISDAYRQAAQRKRVEETLRLQAERDRLMGLITQRIRQSLNLDAILNTTVEEVRQLLQNDRVLLFKLCDDGTGKVVCESVASGLPATMAMEFPNEVFPEDCYQHYLKGQPRVVADITHDEFAPCLTEFLQDLGVKSKLVIPILRSTQPTEQADRCSLYPEISLWGVMTAHDCSGHRKWQQWEIDLLSSLATQIGIAIQQSELYLQLEVQLTELQQAEAALQQAKQAAEVANYAKSEFLANMSHELRTPLNGILGYAQILKQDTNLTGQQRDNLSIIYQCGEHLLTLINDILDLSKIEAQRMELYPTEFHLPNFLKILADFFRMCAQQKDIIFTYESLPSLPNAVIADPKRLRQVLINLLSNAVKFTDKGGVRLRVGYLSVVSRQSSVDQKKQRTIDNGQLTTDKIRFQIEDTGIGIEPSQLAEIFLPFHQVGDRARAIDGTGLGLAISQKLVQMMGSEIKVRSTLGEGSVFWFDLDLPKVPGWQEPNQSESRRLVGFKGHKRKVLIVDDNQVNCAILRQMLEPLGFEILEAVDGQDCLNKAIEFQPDLILMDLLMPVLDGFEVTRRLRQLPELKDVVAIALSANVFESTKQKSLAAGCQDFLPKPVQAKLLLESVIVHLGLEGIYEEPLHSREVELNLCAAPDVPPPPEAIATLSQLVKMGDITGILDQAAQLEKLDNKFVPFATQMRQLAKAFKLKQLLEILQKYRENN